MLASDVVTKVRDILADPSGDRWSDARIFREINSAQDDIVLKSNLLRARVSIDLNAGQEVYQLPEEVLMVTRVIFNDKVLPIYSRAEMDAKDINWETETDEDTISAIVYDGMNQGQIRPYPILESDIKSSNPNGIITEINYTDPTLVPSFNSPFGNVVAIDSGFNSKLVDIFIVYFIKRANRVTALTDIMELNEVWLSPIVHYVCGSILRSDGDTQNRALGNEEFQLYSSAILETLKNTSKHFTSSGHFESDYRRF